MPQETTYSPRFSTPDFLQREADNTIALPVYRDGAVVPSGGTVSVFDENGEAVVDEQTVTVVSDIATYAISASTLPDTLPLSERWQERWTLTLNGQEYTFWRDACLCLRRLYPVVTDADLTALHTELVEWLAEDATSLQGYIDAAWDRILLRLLEQGRMPYLVMSPWSLRGVHIDLTLAYTFRDYSSSASRDGKYADLAAHYAEQFDAGWDRLRFTYDQNEDDKVSSREQGVSGQPVISTVVPGSWHWGVY